MALCECPRRNIRHGIDLPERGEKLPMNVPAQTRLVCVGRGGKAGFYVLIFKRKLRGQRRQLPHTRESWWGPPCDSQSPSSFLQPSPWRRLRFSGLQADLLIPAAFGLGEMRCIGQWFMEAGRPCVRGVFGVYCKVYCFEDIGWVECVCVCVKLLLSLLLSPKSIAVAAQK